jgi:hypothetical protein
MGGQRGCNRPGHFHSRAVWHRRVTPKSIEQPQSSSGACSTEFRNETHPPAECTAQQLREAFPWDSVPRFLLRERDRIFGSDFTQQVKEFGIREVLGTPRAPQQRAYIERVIGTNSPRVSGACDRL